MDGFVHAPWIGTVTARAKINLALHVVGRRADGYHELESLVAFAEVGDRLEIAPGARETLSVDGPLGDGVPTDGRNLVLKALGLAQELAPQVGVRLSPLSIRLTKHLPHAAGIGGGSADAGALLAWIGARYPALGSLLAARCVSLGADVPMCLTGEAALVRGIGERSERLAALPPLPLLLVNPGVPVSTPAVFAALERRDNPPLAPPPATGFSSLDELVEYLAAARNDLEPPARALAPAIAESLVAVEGSGARFARMSGSGATVFGLFDDDARTAAAARAISEAHPGWWVSATRLTGQTP